MSDPVRNDDMSDLLGHELPKPRKSASHGEAGFERAARDAYFTEPWVTRALLMALEPELRSRAQTIWEPACGDGRMVKEIANAGYSVLASDIHDYGYPHTRLWDFLTERPAGPLSVVITNPPFDLARQFIVRALEVTEPLKGIVAILQRHEFDAPKTNRPLFMWPFSRKLILPRRPRWTDGADKASPRFPYAWYVWDWAHEGLPLIGWLD
jgi:hypothetical protein